MSIDEILEFNKTYSYIMAVVDFIKDTDVDYIAIKDIKSIDMVCGLGDTEPFYDALKDETWGDLFKDKWEGDGYYNIEIAYKCIPDWDDYQRWYYYEIKDIRLNKSNESTFINSIPFDWDDLDL